MSTIFSNHELSPSYPTSISAGAATDEMIRTAGERRPPSGSSLLQRIGNWLSALGQRQQVVNELSSLSDYELADMGLSRSNIHRVFDAGFAAELNARR